MEDFQLYEKYTVLTKEHKNVKGEIYRKIFYHLLSLNEEVNPVPPVAANKQYKWVWGGDYIGNLTLDEIRKKRLQIEVKNFDKVKQKAAK